MGRFYATSSPEYIDYSYKLPVELMGKIIEKTDKEIDDTNLLLSKLPSLLKADALEGADKTRLSQYIQDKDTQISQMSKALIDNPLEARRYKSKIMDLANQITNDTSNGELGYLTKNKKTFDTWFEEQKKRMYGKDEYVSAQDIADKKAVLLKQWNESGGTKFNNGIGNTFSANPLVSNVNAPKEALLIAKEVKPNEFSNMIRDKDGQWQPLGTKLFQSNDPAYLVKFSSQIKELNENKVLGAVYQNLMERPDIQSYYNQKISDAQVLGVKYDVNDMKLELYNTAKTAAQTVAFTEEKRTEQYMPNQRYIDDKNFQQDLFKMRLKNQYDIDAEGRKAKAEKDANSLGILTPFGEFTVPTNENMADMKTNLATSKKKLEELEVIKNSGRLSQAELNANILNTNKLKEQIKNNEEQLLYAGRNTQFDVTAKFNDFKKIASDIKLSLGRDVSKSLTDMTDAEIDLAGKNYGYDASKIARLKDIKKLSEDGNYFANSFYTDRFKGSYDIYDKNDGSFNYIAGGASTFLVNESHEFTKKQQETQTPIAEEAMALVPLKGNDKESKGYRELRGYFQGTVLKNMGAFSTLGKNGLTEKIGTGVKNDELNGFDEKGKVIKLKTSDVLNADNVNSIVGIFKADNKTVTSVKVVDKDGKFKGTVFFTSKDESQEMVANSVLGTVAREMQNSDNTAARQYATSNLAAAEVSPITRGLNANRMSAGQSNTYTQGDFRYTVKKDNNGNFDVQLQGFKNGNYYDATHDVNVDFQEATGNPKAKFNFKAGNEQGLNKILYELKQLQNQ